MSLGSPWMLLSLVLVPLLVLAYVRLVAPAVASCRPARGGGARADRRVEAEPAVAAARPVRALRGGARRGLRRARPADDESRAAAAGGHRDPRLRRLEQHAGRGSRADPAPGREGQRRPRSRSASRARSASASSRSAKAPSPCSGRRTSRRTWSPRSGASRWVAAPRSDRASSPRSARSRGSGCRSTSPRSRATAARSTSGSTARPRSCSSRTGRTPRSSDPLQIAEVASSAGVRVHTVGIGTPEGTVVEIDGFSVATALDEELLTESPK